MICQKLINDAGSLRTIFKARRTLREAGFKARQIKTLCNEKQVLLKDSFGFSLHIPEDIDYHGTYGTGKNWIQRNLDLFNKISGKKLIDIQSKEHNIPKLI